MNKLKYNKVNGLYHYAFTMMGVVCIEKAIDGLWDKKGHYRVSINTNEFGFERFNTLKEAKAYVADRYGNMACDQDTYELLHKAA